jgi:hypothetical protein
MLGIAKPLDVLHPQIDLMLKVGLGKQGKVISCFVFICSVAYILPD